MKKILYRHKETPFEIQSEEDWNKIKLGWWVSYICNTCGERHVKNVSKIKYAKNTCFKKIPYYNKETPFEIQSEEDWKKVKKEWYVTYICNTCKERHIKIISKTKCKKNTCLKKTPHCNKETPFKIQSEEDWKKVKKGWYVTYICNTCKEKHIKIISRSNARNTCQLSYHEETPFEIKSEEDWKNVRTGWYVSYICNTCGERHVKYISRLTLAKNMCQFSYCKKETPFEIQSEEDWNKIKLGWWVSYICNTCGERHVKNVSKLTLAKNTCLNKTKKTKNIMINYRSNYVDRFIFAF